MANQSPLWKTCKDNFSPLSLYKQDLVWNQIITLFSDDGKISPWQLPDSQSRLHPYASEVVSHESGT